MDSRRPFNEVEIVHSWRSQIVIGFCITRVLIFNLTQTTSFLLFNVSFSLIKRFLKIC